MPPITEPQAAAVRSRTAITGADIIAFDGREHRLIRDGVLVYEGATIVHVGRRYDGAVGETIRAPGMLVIPGQISAHAHVSAQEGTRLVTDGGRRDFLRSGFLNYLPTKAAGGPSFLERQDAVASLRFGMAALIRHGVTTAVAFAPGGTNGGRAMVEAADEMGLRIQYAPLVSGGRYHFDDHGRLRLAMDERGGFQMLEAAQAFVERFDGTCDGRVRGLIVLDEYYASTPLLRRRAKEMAEVLGTPLTLHFVEQLREFFETVQGTGLTPLQLLAEENFLGPEVILGHCLYIASHSMTSYPYVDDLDVLACSGASVAHSPLAFARRGVALESFDRYRARGINVALGTDAFPLDMFAEMRTAAMVCKLVECNHEAGAAMAVFEASNLGGARALGRDDLGRLAPGAKADIVLVDVDNLTFGPNPDPIRALVHLATGDMVDTVIVNGRTLLAGKRLLVGDERAILASAQHSSRQVWESFADYHWSGRPVHEVFPPAIRSWED